MIFPAFSYLPKTYYQSEYCMQKVTKVTLLQLSVIKKMTNFTNLSLFNCLHF